MTTPNSESETAPAVDLHRLVSRLSALSAEGTIRITVKAAGRGFQMTFYAATKLFQLDGRDLAGMVGDAEKIQAANEGGITGRGSPGE